MSMLQFKSLQALLIAGGALAVPALAQQAQSADGEDAGPRSASTLEEIVVTAQKREQDLQTVPIAVSAFSADTLEKSGITLTSDIPTVVPNMVLVTGRQGAGVYLRGVGSTTMSPGNEPPVAIYVDGVYYPSVNATTFTLNNIERIEVLRGPQGTLFGRNATGGLLHIISKTPSHEANAEVQLGYGNYDTVTGTFYGTAGLTDTLAADLAATYRSQGEGYGRNLTTGSEVGFNDLHGARAKLLWTPSAGFAATLAADYARRDSDLGAVRRVRAGKIGVDGNPCIGCGFHDTAAEIDPDGYTDQWSLALTAEADLSFASLKSISAYRVDDAQTTFEEDGQPVFLLQSVLTYMYTDTLTQEFQLISRESSPVQWIVGAFYMQHRSDYDPLQLVIQDAPGDFITQERRNTVDTESMAVFAQTTFPLTQKTNLTLGARYSIDDLKFDARRSTWEGAFPSTSPPPATAPLLASSRFIDSETFEKPTWRVSLDHRFTDTFMVYGSYNRGYKAGNYNHSGSGPAVAPEILDAYELGLKSDLLNDRFRLNVVGYYYDYQDMQLETLAAVATIRVNAPGSTIKGVEIETEAVLTDALSLRGSVSVAKGEFDEFLTPAATRPLPGGGNEQFDADAAGQALPQLPDWTLNVGLVYTVPLSAGEASLSANYYYNDGFAWDFIGRYREEPYDVVNLDARWALPSGLTIELWAKNVLDTQYSHDSSAATEGDMMVAAAPRTYGVTFGYKF